MGVLKAGNGLLLVSVLLTHDDLLRQHNPLISPRPIKGQPTIRRAINLAKPYNLTTEQVIADLSQ